MNRAAPLGLGLLLFAAIATGCGKSAPAPSPSQALSPEKPTTTVAKQDKVVIYTSMYEVTVKELSAALKEHFPNRDVEFVSKGGTEYLIAKVESEVNAGAVQADIIMLADPAYARILKSQGRLLQHVPKGIDKVLVDKDPDGYYFGVRVLDSIIIYNTDLVKESEAPKSFKDLIDAKWKGQVALPDPNKSGSTFATVGALVQKYGWPFIEGAEANQWQVGGGSSAAPTKVLDGTAKAGIVLEENYLSGKAQGKHVGIVWPEEGAILVESPLAILKGGPNPEGAKEVADWMLTPEAQGIIAKSGMHPVIAGIKPADGSISLEELLKSPFRVDWDRLAKEKETTQKRIRGILTIKG